METRSKTVGIFWDYENCQIPAELSGYSVVANIRKSLQEYGPIKSLKAYMDVSEQCTTLQRGIRLRSELQLSGVTLIDTPHNGRKNVADQMILVDLLLYALEGNPNTTTIALITGDRDFSYAISTLRLRGYELIVISPSCPTPHPSLTAHASFTLDWDRFVPKEFACPRPLHLVQPIPFMNSSTTATVHHSDPSSGGIRVNSVVPSDTPTPFTTRDESWSSGSPTGVWPVSETYPNPEWSPPHQEWEAAPPPLTPPRKVIKRTERPVPQRFRILVDVLNEYRGKGILRPLRSVIGLELFKTDHLVYKKANVDKFSPYVNLAVHEGVVELGGKDGNAWISLKPEWQINSIGR